MQQRERFSFTTRGVRDPGVAFAREDGASLFTVGRTGAVLLAAGEGVAEDVELSALDEEES